MSLILEKLTIKSFKIVNRSAYECSTGWPRAPLVRNLDPRLQLFSAAIMKAGRGREGEGAMVLEACYSACYETYLR